MAMEEKINLVTLPSSNHVCLLPYQIPQVNKIILRSFALDPKQQLVIVDGTSHIGCDSLNFATIFPNAKIIAVDNDPTAIACLRINVENAKKTNAFEIVESDFETWMESARVVADLYYLDPPWGDNYHSLNEISLFLGDQPIEKIIKRMFELGLTKKVLLKVPRNFAYPSFKNKVGQKTELSYIYKNGRHPQIAYGLVIIG